MNQEPKYEGVLQPINGRFFDRVFDFFSGHFTALEFKIVSRLVYSCKYLIEKNKIKSKIE